MKLKLYLFCILNFVNLAAQNCIKGNGIKTRLCGGLKLIWLCLLGILCHKKKDIIYEDFSPE